MKYFSSTRKKFTFFQPHIANSTGLFISKVEDTSWISPHNFVVSAIDEEGSSILKARLVAFLSLPPCQTRKSEITEQ